MSGSSWATESFQDFARRSREDFEAVKLRHAEVTQRGAEQMAASAAALLGAVRDSLVAGGFLNVEPEPAESRESPERGQALRDEVTELRAVLGELLAHLDDYHAATDRKAWVRALLDYHLPEARAALRGDHQAESGGES